MNRTPVISSNLNSVGYEDGTLEVQFRNGMVYQFMNVPEHVYTTLMNAPSKGRYFRKEIRDKYQTSQIR